MAQRKLNQIFVLLLMAVLIPACGGKSSSNNNSTATQYVMQNGVCVNVTTGQTVSNSLCSNQTGSTPNSVFTMNGNQCYDSFANRVVNNAYCTSNQFTWDGSNCRDNFTGQNVSSVYCQSTPGAGSNRYVITNGRCYDSQNRTYVDFSHCGTSGQPNPGTSQCFESYYSLAYGGFPQKIQCYGQNCTGQSLYEYHTGQQVFCQ